MNNIIVVPINPSLFDILEYTSSPPIIMGIKNIKITISLNPINILNKKRLLSFIFSL